MDKNSLTDEAIGVIVDARINDATSWYSSKLSREREEVLKYYSGELPEPQHDTGADFVTNDVYDYVQMMKAQLVETFSAGTGMIRFNARNPADKDAARIATEYCSHVVYNQNHGEALFRDVIHDALTCRVGLAKVWYDKGDPDVQEEFDNITPEEMEAWQRNPNIKQILTGQNEDGTYYGTVLKGDVSGQVRIESINPEEFAIERQAERLSEEYFCVHRTMQTVDWVTSTYPEFRGREDELKGGGGDDLSNTPEVLARFSQTDTNVRDSSHGAQDELRKVLVSEAYIKLRRKGDLKAVLYKVVRCGKVTLEMERCQRLPFVAYVPLPEPHNFYGTNYASKIIDTQHAQTTLTRAILDHTALTTNPRLMIVKGGVVNPKELIMNRLGGPVNVRSADSIGVMPQPAMNPYVFTLQQAIQARIENTTGIGAQSTALTKDAISNQNSASMMETVLNAQGIRQKEMARCFVDQFLIPLWCKVYDLVVAYEDRNHIVEVTGGWALVNPTAWTAGRTASASAHLGYGERAAQANEIMQLAAFVNQPGSPAAQFQGPQGGYAMLAAYMNAKGWAAQTSEWFPITPDQLQPREPSPMEMAKIKHLLADADAKTLTAQTLAKKVTDHGGLALVKEQGKQSVTAAEMQIRIRDADRKDVQVQNEIITSQAELEMAQQQLEANPEAVKAIISPNS